LIALLAVWMVASNTSSKRSSGRFLTNHSPTLDAHPQRRVLSIPPHTPSTSSSPVPTASFRSAASKGQRLPSASPKTTVPTASRNVPSRRRPLAQKKQKSKKAVPNILDRSPRWNDFAPLP
jgi:hypothetical protein